jgi:AAA family ATP:ADP antiporter
MTVPKEYSSMFILLFEHTDFGYKLDRLAKFYKEPVMNISAMAKTILTVKQGSFSDWTKACVLYNLKNEKGLLGTETVQPYLESENLMLSEIAALIIKRENQVV